MGHQQPQHEHIEIEIACKLSFLAEHLMMAHKEWINEFLHPLSHPATEGTLPYRKIGELLHCFEVLK